MTTRTFFALLAAGLGLCATQVQATNTMVRFTYYHGSVKVGSMDVELFDQDKPVTVSNFLQYVRSGAYDNLMLHRCVPGFVIQGGGVRSYDPLLAAPPNYQLLSSSLFQDYFLSRLSLTPNFGTITNEFDVGPRYSNTVGMLAMARAVPGGSDTNLTHEEMVRATNSASTDWFINLADNSSTLDTNWGGFTVFGRVVAGTNMLDFFNRTNANFSVLEMDFLYFPGVSVLGSVPVSYPALYPFPRTPPYPPVPKRPAFNQIYHVRIAEFPATDVKRPTVAITSPASGAKLTNTEPEVTIKGTATDNVGIRSIWYSLNEGQATNVAAGPQWSVTTDITAGTNYFYVQSVDTAGQRSPVASRNFFFSVREPLSLTNVGNGTVIGATNQQRFEIGRLVSLTAKPGPGHLFAGWTSGTYFSEAAALRFLMFSNANVTATFVTNPFPPLKATYAGLFYNTNFSIQTDSPRLQPSGAITLTVTDLGAVSGRLSVAGRSLPFSGKISPYGVANISVAAGSVAPLFAANATWKVVFNLDVTNRSDQIRGGYVWDEQTFNSALALDRVRPGTSANRSPFEGKYTLAIPPGTNSTQPGGWGYGAATVNTAGNVTLAGTLADGTTFTQTAPVIAANGLWPFYVSLYAGKGWMWGWLKMEPGQPGGDLSGSMVWRKTGPQVGKPYPNGFEFYPLVTGSRYMSPTTTNRVLELSEGILALTGTNLAAHITNRISLAVNNTVKNLDTNRLTFALVKANGLFSGTVRPVGEARTLTYKGAVLRTQGYGVGYYLSTNQSGTVYFGP